jgi:hypothetical protein
MSMCTKEATGPGVRVRVCGGRARRHPPCPGVTLASHSRHTRVTLASHSRHTRASHSRQAHRSRASRCGFSARATSCASCASGTSTSASSATTCSPRLARATGARAALVCVCVRVCVARVACVRVCVRPGGRADWLSSCGQSTQQVVRCETRLCSAPFNRTLARPVAPRSPFSVAPVSHVNTLTCPHARTLAVTW